MNKLFFILIFIPLYLMQGQERFQSNAFSKFDIGFYGGINSKEFSNVSGIFLFEIKTNILNDLYLKLNTGYLKVIQPINSQVKTYSEGNFPGFSGFASYEYIILRKNYDIFPISIGFQYIIKNGNISLYSLLDLNYNSIFTRTDKSPGPGASTRYSSYDELPDEFKSKYISNDPNHSYGISPGFGILYPLTSSVNIDLKYFYKIDSEIINSHNIVAGICF